MGSLAFAFTLSFTINANIFPTFGNISLLIGRITQYPSFLRDALHQPRANWRITRVHITDIILKFVECFWIVVDEEAEGFAEGGEWVFRGDYGRGRVSW